MTEQPVVAVKDSDVAANFIQFISYFSASSQTELPDVVIYEFPRVPETTQAEIIRMLKDGVSVSGCCKYVSRLFYFDPAVVNAVWLKQFEPQAALYCLIANCIAWISSEEFGSIDYFVLLVHALTSDQTMFTKSHKYCLKMIVGHLEQNAMNDLPANLITQLANFFVAANCEVEFMLDILMHFMKNSRRAHNEQIFTSSMKYVDRTIRQNQSRMRDYDFSEILKEIAGLIAELNFDGMTLLSVISDIQPNQEVIELWKTLANNVVDKMNSGKRTEFVAKNPTPEIQSSELTDLQLNFSTFVSFPSKIDSLPNDLLFSNISPVDVVDDVQFSLLNACQPLLHRKFTAVIDAFMDEVSLRLDTMEVCFFFVSLLENLPEYILSDESLMRLESSGLFSPTITIFYEEEFAVYNRVRNSVIQRLTTNHPERLVGFVSLFKDHHAMFTECAVRIRSFTNDVRCFIDEEIAAMIAQSLQLMAFSLSRNFTEELHLAWATLFAFASSVAENSKVNNIVFASLEFTNSILGHCFHQSLRASLFTMLRKYMTQPESKLDAIAQFCQVILHSSLFGDEQLHAVSTELINCIEHAMNHRQDMVKDLLGITPAIISFFLKFPTKELLDCTLNFLMLISFNWGGFGFSHAEMLQLGKTIRNTETEGLSESTVNFLMSLVAGNKNTTNNFIIRNPSFILLVLNASSDDIGPLIEVFYRLCRFSIFNCIQCHKSELDLILIQLLKSYPDPFTFMGCEFQSKFTEEKIHEVVIPFITLLFTYSCSPQTVERFIDVAVPSTKHRKTSCDAPKRRVSEGAKVVTQVDDCESVSDCGRVSRRSSQASMGVVDKKKVKLSTIQLKMIRKTTDGISVKHQSCSFGRFADKVVDQMAQLLANDQQICYTYSKKSRPLDFPAIPFSEIEDGFTFSCHMILDSPVADMSRQVLFNLTDSQGTTFTVYTNGKSLLCEIKSAWGVSSASIMSTLPSCEWIMITIAVKAKNEDVMHLNFSFNKEPPVLFTVRNPGLTGPTVFVEIGGSMDDTISDQVFCFLGAFRLFGSSMSSSEVAKLYSSGRKRVPNLLDDNIKPVTAGYITPFQAIFRTYGLIDSILPFFSFINAAPPFFIEKIVDLLRYSDSDRYYNLISQFLMKADQQHLTYSLYLRFFTLFTECNSSELFNHILLNFEIWCGCQDPVHVRRIVNHWHQVLFPDFTENFISFTSFANILSQIRVFFWFSSEESENICLRRSPDLDIASIRTALNKLLAKFAAVQLSHSDVQSLLSHIETTHDIQQKLYFLSLLMDIQELLPNKRECISQLHTLFSTARSDVFATTLQVIMGLSKREEVGKQVEYVIGHINKIHFTSDIFDSVLALCDLYPELLTLSAMLAINIGKEQEALTVKRYCRLVAKECAASIANVKTWYIWSAILLLRSPPETQEQFIDAMWATMLENRQDIDDFLCFLDLICLKHNLKVTTIRLYFIRNIARQLTSDVKNPSKIIYRCSRYLLFQFASLRHSSHILDEFYSSPFYDGKIERSAHHELNVKTIHDICEILRCEGESLIFHVDIDKESVHLFAQIIEMIDNYLQICDLHDDTLKKYADFFRYLHNKDNMKPDQRFKTMHSLSASMWNGIQVMDISFNAFLTKNRTDLEKYITQTTEKSVRLFGDIKSEIIQLSLVSIDMVQSKRLMNYGLAENDYSFLGNQYMNNTSIWRGFSSNRPRLKRSYRIILENYTSIELKNHYKRFSIEKDLTVIRGSPIIKMRAKLIKMEGYQPPVVVAVMEKKILIGRRTKVITIPNNEVRFVLFRPANSYEIVTKSGKSYLLDFQTERTSKFIGALRIATFDVQPLVQISPYNVFIQKLNITNDWVIGSISNFDYIMRLNFFGGYSFHSRNRYPVFPLLRYSNGELRDLSKPLGANSQVWLQLFSCMSHDANQDTEISDAESWQFVDMDESMNNSLNEECDEIQEEEETVTELINKTELPESSSLAQVLERNAYELSPEFFSMPEAFRKLSVKPNEYEFVWDLRKLLESEYVSKNLHVWIDNVFGCENPSKHKLFNGPHPPRRVFSSEIVVKKIQQATAGLGNLTYSVIDQISSDKIVVYAVTGSMVKIVGLELDSSKATHVEFITHKNISVDDSVIGFTSNGVVLIDHVNSEVKYMNAAETRTFTRSLYPVNNCAENGLCLSDDGVAYTMEKSRDGIETFGICKISPDSPVCATSNTRYQVVAIGVRSGRVLLFERKTGLFLREIAGVGPAPKRIAICDAFPLLVIQYPDALKVYSIYGSLIKEISITFDIAMWTTGVSKDGIDYIFISDTTCGLLYMDVCSLTVNKLVRLGSRTMAMKYIKNAGLFCVTQEGKVVLIPAFS